MVRRPMASTRTSLGSCAMKMRTEMLFFALLFLHPQLMRSQELDLRNKEPLQLVFFFNLGLSKNFFISTFKMHFGNTYSSVGSLMLVYLQLQLLFEIIDLTRNTSILTVTASRNVQNSAGFFSLHTSDLENTNKTNVVNYGNVI